MGLVRLSLCTVQRDGVVPVDYYYWLRDPKLFGWALRADLDRSGNVKYAVSSLCGETLIDLESHLHSGVAIMVH